MKNPLAYNIPGTTEPHSMSLALSIKDRFIVCQDSSNELSGNLQKYLDQNINEINFRHLIHGVDNVFIMYTARLGKFVGSIVMIEESGPTMSVIDPATCIYTESPQALLAFKEHAINLKDKKFQDRVGCGIGFLKTYREKALLEKELAPASIDKIIEKLKI